MGITANDLIQDTMRLKGEALLQLGVTPIRVIGGILDLTTATKTDRCKLKGKLSGPSAKRLPKHTRKIAETDEEIIIERDYADNQIRLNAFIQLKQILGLDAAAKNEISGAGGASFAEELTAVLKKIDGKSRGILPCDQEDL